MRQINLLNTLFLFLLLSGLIHGQSQSNTEPFSVSGFKHWITGRDSATVQLIPATGANGLLIEKNKTVAHARFRVSGYGEMSFPISTASLPHEEALSVDLSNSRFIKITYKANQNFVLQLRQTGVHGGVHNHVLLPASSSFKTITIYFSSFRGGLKPLKLRDVSKFNFAFLENNSRDGYADLVIRSVVIDGYKP